MVKVLVGYRSRVSSRLVLIITKYMRFQADVRNGQVTA